MRSHHYSVLKVDLVRNNHTGQLLVAILLLDAIVPLSQKMECILIGNIIHKHDQVSLAKQLESNLLEDVLTGDVDTVQLDSLVVVLLIQLDVLHMVLATLGHHVLMVERLVDGLVHEAGLAHSWLTGDNDTRS